MKRFILPVISILVLTGCSTIQPIAETAQKAVVEVQDEHSPAEWTAFYDVLGTLTAKAQEIAMTKTGAKVFGKLEALALARADQWRADVPARAD